MTITEHSTASRRGRRTRARSRAEAFAVGGRVVQDALAGWFPVAARVDGVAATTVRSPASVRSTAAQATFQIAGFRCDAHALRDVQGHWHGWVDICLLGTETVVRRVAVAGEHGSTELFLAAARSAAFEGVESLSRCSNVHVRPTLD
jgi:hypothetical protein